MPSFQTLSKAEVEKLARRRAPRTDLSEYLSYLGTLKSGDWARVTLGEGESQRTVKRRLTVASKQRGMQIKYRRSREPGQILFEVR